MEKLKFKLTKETKINVLGVKLFRIEATQDISVRGIKKGDKGGWVSSERTNYGNARVSGDAWVYGNAEVYGNAIVSGNAWVSGDAVATRRVENWISPTYNITITNKHIQIGCQQLTHEDAYKLRLNIKSTESKYGKNEVSQAKKIWPVVKAMLKLRMGL